MADSDIRLLTVAEFVELHEDRVSADLVYDLVRSGKLPALRVGTKKILIPHDGLERMFHEQEERRRHLMAGTLSGTKRKDDIGIPTWVPAFDPTGTALGTEQSRYAPKRADERGVNGVRTT